VSLRALDKSITVPTVMGAALRLLMSGAPVEARDLPDLDDNEQLVLVRRLLREGVVVPAPGDGAAAGV